MQSRYIIGHYTGTYSYCSDITEQESREAFIGDYRNYRNCTPSMMVNEKLWERNLLVIFLMLA